MTDANGPSESDALLMVDLQSHAEPIKNLVLVPLEQYEYDALLSFVFNIGVSGFTHSSVLRYLNLGDRKQSANSFMLWDKPTEILSRRRGECEQFKGLRFEARIN